MKTQRRAAAAVTVPATEPDHAGDRRLRPLMQLLIQLQSVLSNLDKELYARKPVGVMPGHVGAHVRHCIDHVRLLLDAASTGHLDYDNRDRGSDIETNLAAAVEALGDLIGRLAECPAATLQRPLTVSMVLVSSDPPVRMPSTFEREAAYVFSHTVHHNAIIAAMVRMLGGQVPEDFGYAPSTIAYLNRTSRAGGS